MNEKKMKNNQNITWARNKYRKGKNKVKQIEKAIEYEIAHNPKLVKLRNKRDLLAKESYKIYDQRVDDYIDALRPIKMKTFKHNYPGRSEYAELIRYVGPEGHLVPEFGLYTFARNYTDEVLTKIALFDLKNGSIGSIIDDLEKRVENHDVLSSAVNRRNVYTIIESDNMKRNSDYSWDTPLMKKLRGNKKI